MSQPYQRYPQPQHLPHQLPQQQQLQQQQQQIPQYPYNPQGNVPSQAIQLGNPQHFQQQQPHQPFFSQRIQPPQLQQLQQQPPPQLQQPQPRHYRMQQQQQEEEQHQHQQELPQDPPMPIIEMLKRDEFFGPDSVENILSKESVSKGYCVSEIVRHETRCSLLHAYDSQPPRTSFLNTLGKPEDINNLRSFMTKTIYQINYQHKINKNEDFIIGKKRQRTQYYEGEDEWETNGPDTKRPSSYVRKLGVPSHSNTTTKLEKALLRQSSLVETSFKFPFFSFEELFTKQKELNVSFYRSLLFLNARLLFSANTTEQDPLGKLLGIMYEYTRSDPAGAIHLSFFLNYCFKEGMFPPKVLFSRLLENVEGTSSDKIPFWSTVLLDYFPEMLKYDFDLSKIRFKYLDSIKKSQNPLKVISKVTKEIEKQFKLSLENNLDDAYNMTKYDELISQLQEYFQDSFDEMILLICEWAVTDQRIEFKNRDMYAATLFNKLLSLPPKAFPPQSLFYSTPSSIPGMFQRVAYHFIDNYTFRTDDEKLSMVKLLTSLSRFDLFSYNEYIKTLICRNKLSSHSYFVANTPCVLRVTPETLIPLLGKGPRLTRNSEEFQRDALITTQRAVRRQAEMRLEELLLSENGLSGANVQEFLAYFRTLCYHDKVYLSDWLTDMFFVKNCLCKRAGDKKVLCFCEPDVKRFRLVLALLEESQNYVSLASFLLRVLKSPRYANAFPILLQAVLSVSKNSSVFYVLDSIPRLESILETLNASLAKRLEEAPVLVPLLIKKIQDPHFTRPTQDSRFMALITAPSVDSAVFEGIIASHEYSRAIEMFCENLGALSGLVKALLSRVKLGTDIPNDSAFLVGLFNAIEDESYAYALAEAFFVCIEAASLEQSHIDFLCSIMLDSGSVALRTFIEPYRVVNLISNVSFKKTKQSMQQPSSSPIDPGAVAVQRMRALLTLSDFVEDWKPVGSLLSYVSRVYGSNPPQFPQELAGLFADKRAKVKHIFCGQFEYFTRMFQKHGFFGSAAYMAIMRALMESELPEQFASLSTAQTFNVILSDVAAVDGLSASTKWKFGFVLSYFIFNLYKDPEATRRTFARVLFLRLFALAEGSGSSYARTSVALNMYASIVNIMGEDTQAAFMEVVKEFVSSVSFANYHSISDFVLKLKQEVDSEEIEQDENCDVCLTFGDILSQMISLILSPSASKAVNEAINTALALRSVLTELHNDADNAPNSEEYLFVLLKVLEVCLLSSKRAPQLIQNAQMQQSSSLSSSSSFSASTLASAQDRMAGLSELVSILTETIAHPPVVSDMSGGITSLVVRSLCALLALFPADQSNMLKKRVKDMVLNSMAGVSQFKREAVFRVMAREGLFNEERTQKDFMSYSFNVVNRFAPTFLHLAPQSSTGPTSLGSSASLSRLPPSCKVLNQNEKFIYELYSIDDFFQYSFPKAVSIYGVKKSSPPEGFYEDSDGDNDQPSLPMPNPYVAPAISLSPHRMPNPIPNVQYTYGRPYPSYPQPQQGVYSGIAPPQPSMPQFPVMNGYPINPPYPPQQIQPNMYQQQQRKFK